MKTIRKNTKARAAAIANAKDLQVFTLNNNFTGAPVASILPHHLESSKLSQHEDGKYSLHVHSNCWYEFTA